MKFLVNLYCICCLVILVRCQTNHGVIAAPEYFDVIVYGNGTGAITSAIQSGQGGSRTLLISPSPWLGGMVSSAGVSATDGNHRLPSGLWGEFRQKIYDHYGGPDSVFTGWVSNTNFEPHVADLIWKNMASKVNQLHIIHDYRIKGVKYDSLWTIDAIHSDHTISFKSKILIDGTDLGDLLPMANLDYDIGWDEDLTGPVGFVGTKDYIQDLTYCAILKDYGLPQEIPVPEEYTPNEFNCSCQHQCNNPEVHDCGTMLNYAKLPNQKYLLNWPIQGNDLYPTLDIFDLDKRQEILDQAKQKTLRFAYYIHDELGYTNLWLADDEFETPDLMPYEAYYREARRMQGQVRFSIQHIAEPYKTNYFRSGIAVGDYPVDHHHDEYPKHTDRSEFPKIPSYTIPLGVIIPKILKNFLVADKSISVTHEANGTTRLQPVIMQLGQAAGALAAKAIQENVSVHDVPVRDVQNVLLENDVFLQPFLDVTPNNKYFKAIQRIGCTGLLKGTGVPFQWANQTWFYPDTIVRIQIFAKNINELLPDFSSSQPIDGNLLVGGAFLFTWELKKYLEPNFNTSKTDYVLELQQRWDQYSTRTFNPFMPILKKELAMILDFELDPFNNLQIDYQGLITES